MKRIALFSTVVAAGLLTAAPAFAADQTTAPPSSTTGSPTPTTQPAPTTEPTSTPPADDGGDAGVPKAYLRVLPSSGRAGDKVVVRVGCEAQSIAHLTSAALDIGPLHPVGSQDDPDKAPVSQGRATVRENVKPGTYKVSFECGSAAIATKFTVLPAKQAGQPQVGQVPMGAPQTGGTDGPVDDSSPGLPIAAAAMGVLALGGTGLVAARRRVRG